MLTWAGVHCDCMHPVYMAKLPCSLPSPISRGSPPRSARRPSRWTSGERPLPDLPRTPQESWDLLCQPLFPRLCCPCGSLGGDAAPPWPLHSLSPPCLALSALLSNRQHLHTVSRACIFGYPTALQPQLQENRYFPLCSPLSFCPLEPCLCPGMSDK